MRQLEVEVEDLVGTRHERVCSFDSDAVGGSRGACGSWRWRLRTWEAT